MRREKIFGMLILAMMLMFQTSSLMAQNKREFRGAWIQCVNGQYLGKSTQQIQSMLTKQLDGGRRGASVGGHQLFPK